MTKLIKLKKGFDINLIGKAAKRYAEVDQPETFAYKPSSFKGIKRPKLLVAEGDNVKAGTPIFYDKKNDRVMHASPVSGEVVEVRRGEKRKILEVVILADKEMEYVEYGKNSVSDIHGITKESAQELMLKSGVWVNIIRRPYGVIADPEDTPKAIFISAFDSHPLAPEYEMLFKGEDNYFQAGVDILKKFTPGIIHLNIDGSSEVSQLFSHTKGIQLNKFSGPHPSGNVGVQIHHLDPINKGDVVWTINPFGVIQLGKLFLNGVYDASAVVALTGSEVKNPQYYKTYLGASIKKMIADNITGDHVRYVAGNVLTGTKIDADGHLGHFDHQVTVIPEGDYYELFGWIKPTTEKLSFQRAFGLLSFFNKKKQYVLDTNMKGEPRAFVQSGVLEKVMPMDILPTHLLKAILAEDFDDMEALGIYEIIEEDMALCEFVDVSKHDIQKIVREGLDLVQYS